MFINTHSVAIKALKIPGKTSLWKIYSLTNVEREKKSIKNVKLEDLRAAEADIKCVFISFLQPFSNFYLMDTFMM